MNNPFTRFGQVVKAAFTKSIKVTGTGSRRSSRTNNSTQEQITDYKLLQNFKRYTYACATINAAACAKVKLKLYVKTEQGDAKPRVKTAPVKADTYKRLTDRFNLHKHSLKSLEEVTEHPALNQINVFNDSPLINGYQARLWTFLYLEILGRAYWLQESNLLFNIPSNYWVLPSQLVTPIQTFNSDKIVDSYRFTGGGNNIKEYAPEQIIQFLIPNLYNPYISALGGGEASFQAANISNKLTDHETSFLDNQARPDFVLSPKDNDNMIGEDEAEQLEEKWNGKFGRGRSGGVYVPTEAMTLQPITFPPKDLANLEIDKRAKHEICNTMQTPIALLEAENINKATLDGALTQHAILKVAPTLELVQSILNDRILPQYDQSGRLMFCYENCVPEDREAKMMETVQLKSNGITTANEARDEYGYPPRPDGDKLESQNVAGSGAKERDTKRKSGSSQK